MASAAPSADPPSPQQEGAGAPVLVNRAEEVVALPAPSILHTVLEYAAIGLAAYAGFTVRFFLDSLGKVLRLSSPEGPIGASFLANLLGCVLMGMLVAEKQRSFMTTPRHVVLFNALAGGGCGSLTTFSTWQSDALWGVVNLDTPVIVYLLTLLVGFCSFYMCLLFGSHLGALLRRFVLHPTRLDVGNNPSSHQNAAFPAPVDWLLLSVLVLYGLATVAFVVLAALLPASRPFWLSLLFGAGGAYLRFRLSLWLNPLWLRFPLATFLINVSGTLLLGGLTVLYHHLWNGNVYYMLNLGSEPAMVSAAYASAYLLPALMQGFCGCFTTVSTFVNEVRSLPAPYEYAYAGASIVTAQALLVPIYVGYFKTR